MPVNFDCPSCKATYEVADDLAGKMIMCRVCQKRGPVRSLTATTSPAASKSSTEPSRRNFLIGGIVASLGAIGAGALLARQPWRHWGEEPPPPDDSPDRRRFRGPPPDADKQKQDSKGPGV